VCDLETSRIGAPYIYDISNLRVNSSDDGHMAARNMYRIEINTHEKEFASSWLFTKKIKQFTVFK